MAVVLVASTAMAEGYQINTLSAKQMGMGHTGIAMKLGGESMFFNPAGMAYMDHTLDISGSFTGIMADGTAETGGTKYKTDNGVSTPLNVNAAFSIYPNLKAGLSFYTPYGSSINWTNNWPGATLSQNVDLKVFTIQPTIAWAITPKLSVGVGAMVSWGSVDLNKGLVPASTADEAIKVMKSLGQLPAETPAFGTTTPASVNLNGKSGVVVGINAGVLYNINDKISVGASFRSKMGMKVKAGNASVTYANDIAEGMLGSYLGLLNNANFSAEMPCPYVVGIGVSYKPVKKLTLAFDARLTGWNAYKSLSIDFLSEQLDDYDQFIEKNYGNSMSYSLGAQYALTDRFDLRLGVMVDTSPVNDKFYNPETPGMTKIEPTLGLSFRPLPSLSIDLGFMYVAGLGAKNVSCTYDDFLGARFPALVSQQLSGLGFSQAQIAGILAPYDFQARRTFTADYHVHAFIPSIGISYAF